jgi:hypothetical protein
MFRYLEALLLVTAAWTAAAVAVGLAGTALLVKARCTHTNDLGVRR